MTDYFALLGLAPAAALEEEALRQRYHELSREAHPDLAATPEEREAAGARSAQLNLAWETLRQPVKRLRHLMELRGAVPGGAGMLSGAMMELFGQVGGVLQEADGVLVKRARAQSKLGKALLAEEEMAAQLKLQEVSGELTRRWNGLVEDLAALDLEDAKALAQAHTQLSFLDKWLRQIQEKLLRFMTES